MSNGRIIGNRYAEDYTILAHDVDAKYNLKPSAFFKYIQETANHQMRDCGPNYEELFNEGKAFILSRISMKIYSHPTQYENILAETWSCEGKGILFDRCYRLLKNGIPFAEAISEWALVDTVNHSFLRRVNIEAKNVF